MHCCRFDTFTRIAWRRFTADFGNSVTRLRHRECLPPVSMPYEVMSARQRVWNEQWFHVATVQFIERRFIYYLTSRKIHFWLLYSMSLTLQIHSCTLSPILNTIQHTHIYLIKKYTYIYFIKWFNTNVSSIQLYIYIILWF